MKSLSIALSILFFSAHAFSFFGQQVSPEAKIVSSSTYQSCLCELDEAYASSVGGAIALSIYGVDSDGHQLLSSYEVNSINKSKACQASLNLLIERGMCPANTADVVQNPTQTQDSQQAERNQN